MKQVISISLLIIGVVGLIFTYYLHRKKPSIKFVPVCPNSSYVGMCDICKGYHFGIVEGPFTIEHLELGNYEAKE